jgi:hypothetical protein
VPPEPPPKRLLDLLRKLDQPKGDARGPTARLMRRHRNVKRSGKLPRWRRFALSLLSRPGRTTGAGYCHLPASSAAKPLTFCWIVRILHPQAEREGFQ